MLRLSFLTLSLSGAMAMVVFQPNASAENSSPQLTPLLKLQADGNHKEAYEGLQAFVLGKDAGPADLARAFGAAIECLQQLNRVDEIDEFREKAVAAHPGAWQLLAAVAESYLNVPHYGYMIGGKFHRGQHRGGGKVIHATDRDRVRALQLYRSAMRHVEVAGDMTEPAEMLRRFANALISGQAWRLQLLTDLDQLPDYEDGWGHGGEPQGAPVDAEGNPIVYALPKSWEAAQNDGERWRWVLETMVEWKPALRNDERMIRAQFLESQFGVQTLVQYGLMLPQPADAAAETSEKPNGKTGIWALDTLGEDETIARLATGVKRFKLPDEHNFIKLYQQVAEDSAGKKAGASGALGLDAVRSLAQLFENRRQYPRAAEFWRMAIERSSGDERVQFQRRLKQIVGNWGQFEAVMSQPAGRGATVDFRFRNAKRVDFVAHEINIRQLLGDVKAYLKSKPKQLDWERMNIGDIGHRLVQSSGKKYVGAEVAQWKLDLEPSDKHFDKRMTISTPLQKAGAYLVTAKLADGNTSKIILWLSDTAIVRKPMQDKSFYFVADAVTGVAIAKANVEFFAYRQRQVDGNNFQIDTKSFAEATDANGQVFLPVPDDNKDAAAREYQWIATATTPGGRLAYVGFHNVWSGRYYDAQYNEVKTFAITDRPVYRPGQTVQFKFWVAQAQYDAEDKSSFAHQAFAVEIHNPKGEKVYGETLTSDNYGGIAGEVRAAERRHAGRVPDPGRQPRRRYRSASRNTRSRSSRSRVDAPAEPVMLGEKITATIRAKYYFGSPVTNATVKYKVMRSEHTRAVVPAGAVGLAVRPRLLVVRVRLRLVSRLARLGLLAALAAVVLASAGAAGDRGRARSADRPRRHGEGRDRHVDRQGDARRPGPPLRNSGGGRRPIAADDRRQRPGARGPQAVQGVRLGRPRLLPRGRHDQRQRSPLGGSTANRSKARANCGC